MRKPPRKILAVGPWVGEFGWEVAQWIPYLRGLLYSHQAYRVNKVSLTVPESTQSLYETLKPGMPLLDIKPYRLDHLKGQPDMNKRRISHNRIVQTPHVFANGYEKFLDPQTLSVTTERSVPMLQGFKVDHPYARPRDGEYDTPLLIIHGRRVDRHKERNFQDMDRLLLEIGKTEGIEEVAFTGSKHDYRPPAYLMPDLPFNVVDLRASLDVSLRYINEVQRPVIGVGASSGPMHLLQHCHIPIVVWSGNPQKDRLRYEHVWNPFQTKVEFLEGWQPAVDDIISAIRRLAKRLR